MQGLGITLFALCLIFLVARLYIDVQRDKRVRRSVEDIMDKLEEARDKADREAEIRRQKPLTPEEVAYAQEQALSAALGKSKSRKS